MRAFFHMMVARIRAFFRPGGLDRDFDQELQAHLAMAEEAKVRQGLTAYESRRAARIELGGLPQLREASRRARGLPVLDAMWQDVRVAARSLLRSPLATGIAVVTLTVVVGSNVAVFALVDGVLLRPLPFAAPERLVLIWHNNLSRDLPFNTVSYPTFLDVREASQTLLQVAAIAQVIEGFTIVDGPDLRRIQGQSVSVGFFNVLGVPALIGQTLRAPDHQPGAERVVVLSHAFWQQRYASEPSAIGRSLLLENRPYTIVGVMPEGFDYPRGAVLWVPLERLHPELVDQWGVGWTVMLGRLAPGVTHDQAQAELDTLTMRLLRESVPAGISIPRYAATLVPFEDDYFGGARAGLVMLWSAVGLVWLIGIVNVAGLLLVRGFARQREVLVRIALGAGRLRAGRQMLVESGLLAVIGSGLGVGLAHVLVGTALALSPDEVPGLASVGIDRTAVGVALLLAAVTGFLCGAVPAAVLTRTSEVRLAQGDSRVARASGHGINRFLVVVEVALSLVLLVGAALMLQSFTRLSRVDLGFEPSQLLAVEVPLSEDRYPEMSQRRAFFALLIEQISARPDVESAASVLLRPLRGPEDYNWPVTIEGQSDEEAVENPAINLQAASVDYFRTIGTALLEGRALSATDRVGAPGVVLVSRQFAERFWPGQSALGRRVKFPLPDTEYRNAWLTVVGVVEPVRYRGLVDARLDLYMSIEQIPYPPLHVMVRTTGDPLALARPIREIVKSLDAAQAIDEVVVMDQVVSTWLGDARFRAYLLAAFALVALSLSALGLYAVMSYLVSLRRPEIGVRIALGATRSAILTRVLRHGIALVVVGAGVGTVGALATTRVLEGLLYEVSAGDATTLVASTLVLLLIGAVASLVPAVRATRVDPTETLRAE